MNQWINDIYYLITYGIDTNKTCHNRQKVVSVSDVLRHGDTVYGWRKYQNFKIIYETSLLEPNPPWMYSAAVANVCISDMGVASKFNGTCIERPFSV